MLSFLTLFSSTLIAKDKESAFLERLYTTPLKSHNFILGYLLPLIPLGLLQSIVTYIVAMCLGLSPSINILYAILLGLLTLGKRFRPRYENQWGRCVLGCIIIAFMWGYAWITGMTPSVVRCVVMITLVEIGRMFYRNSLTINTIAAAAVLILLVRPLDLWSISFQLSFAATIAIVVAVKGMKQLVPLPQRENRWKNRIITYILDTITVSIAAQLGTMPITMYTFGQVSNYFLLTNLIVLPIASLLVPIGLATVAFGGTAIGQFTGYVTYGLAWLMNHSVGWIEQLPGSVTQVHINAWMVLLLYAAMLMGWLTMHRSLWWLIGVASTMIGFCIVYTL